MKHTRIIVGQEYVTRSGRIVCVKEKRDLVKGQGIILMVTDKNHFGLLQLTSSDICWTKEHWLRKQKHLKEQTEARTRNYEARTRRMVEKANKLMVLLGIERSVYSSSVSNGNVNIVFNEHELSVLLTKLADFKA